MDKAAQLFPSVAIVSAIALISSAFVQVVKKRFGDNLKSIKWNRQNQNKVIWLIHVPLGNIFASFAEELIFRLPLIFLFDSLSSSYVWYGILISATLFSAVHWHGKKINLIDIDEADRNNKLESDNLDEEVKRLSQKYAATILTRKITQIVATFGLGILTGYYSIKYQSLWLAVGIHAAWNLLMPIIVIIIGLLIVRVFWKLQDMARNKWRQFKKRRLRNKKMEQM